MGAKTGNTRTIVQKSIVTGMSIPQRKLYLSMVAEIFPD